MREAHVPGAPFSVGVIVLGGGAALLLSVLLLGFFLPSDWEASAEATIGADAAEIFDYLDSPEAWQRWTPWPDSGVVREGPDRGAGATLRWSDRELGSGAFTIETADAGSGVTYTVSVNEGRMATEGSVTLEPRAGGTFVRWSERGDLGRNPIMGYWAAFMDRAQTRELEKGLLRLAELVENAEAPADSVSTGAS